MRTLSSKLVHLLGPSSYGILELSSISLQLSSNAALGCVKEVMAVAQLLRRGWDLELSYSGKSESRMLIFTSYESSNSAVLRCAVKV